ncbi:MAG TPA: hypothetical protein PLK95_10655 [Pseudothermotoga sp.]|nr:hypothetical protein [Pseudothermotoga sp.]
MKKLREDQIKLLERLVRLGIFHDSYLAGGTSLYLKYNHRPSRLFFN